MTSTPILLKYKDLYFRTIAIILGSHFIVSYGMNQSFFQLLLMLDYQIAMAGTIFIASILMWWVNKVSKRLDKKFDWFEKPLQRTGLQLCFGFAIVAIFDFLLAAAYFSLRGVNIFNTYFLQIDFPVIVVLILMINIYYFAYYAVHHALLAKKEVVRLQESLLPIPSLDNDNTVQDNIQELPAKQFYLVNKATKSIPLFTGDIAYFYRKDEDNYVRTFEGENYLISDTLDFVQEQLDTKIFFRANRQIIVNIKACDYYEPLENYKLELFVKPGYDEPIIISQKRIKAFKGWLDR